MGHGAESPLGGILKPHALLYAAMLAATLVPAGASAAHCTEQNASGVGRVTACDNNRDTAPDQAVVVLEAFPMAFSAAAYKQTYSNQGFILARVGLAAGGPFAPAVAHSSRLEDADGSGRYERSVHSGGVFTSGEGSHDLSYLVILRDRNENGQIEDEDVIVCETVKAGCTVIL